MIIGEHKCNICNKKFIDGRAVYEIEVTQVNSIHSRSFLGKRKKKVYICSECIKRIKSLGRVMDVTDRLASEVYGNIDKRVRKLEQYMGLWDDGK